MRTFILKLSFSLIFLIIINTCYATQQLNLSQLENIALQNNKELQAAKINIAIAHAQLVQASQVPNPTLNLADASDEYFNDQGEFTRSVAITQNFPVAGRIKRQKDSALLDIAIATANIANLKRTLSQSVAENYFNYVILEKRIQQMNLLLKINKNLSETAGARLKVAEVSELDANTAKIEYLRFYQQKQALLAQQNKIVKTLNLLLGRSPELELEIDVNVPEIFSIPSLSNAKEMALKNRQDLRAALLSIQSGEANILLAKANKYADWNVGVIFTDNRLAVDGLPQQNRDQTLGVSLSIPLPLFNRNQGQIYTAINNRDRAIATVNALKLQVTTDVLLNYNQVLLYQTIVNQSKKDLLSLTAKNVSLAKSAYQLGQISIFDVVQIQRQQNDVQMAYLSSLTDYYLSWVQLQIAMGNYLNHDGKPYEKNKN